MRSEATKRCECPGLRSKATSDEATVTSLFLALFAVAFSLLTHTIHSSHTHLASPRRSRLRSSLPEKWAAGVIVCDVNKPPTVAIEACDALTPLLSKGALLVLTLKLSCGKSVAGRAAQEKVALEALGRLGGWEEVECRWLFGNTANESTITAVWTDTTK